MKWSTVVPAIAIAALVQTAAHARADGMSQLIAAAGLTETDAASMSLSEIYAYKINRESSSQNQVTVSTREHPTFWAASHRQLVASAGLTPEEARGMSLSELAARKVNRSGVHGEHISILPDRAGSFDPAAHAQLVATAGLTVEEADGASLTEIARLKQNREVRGDDLQQAAR